EKQRIDPGPDHIDTLSMMRNLATAYREAGRFGDALRLLEEALKRSVATLGADDPLTQATRRHLALTQLLKSRTEQYEQRRPAKGDDARDTLPLGALVGPPLRALGSLQAAEAHLRAAYEGRRRILGPEHNDTVIVQTDVGLVLVDQRRFAEAEPYLRRSL